MFLSRGARGRRGVVPVPARMRSVGPRRLLAGRRGDAGFVTAETAVVLPVLLVVLAVGLWAVAVAAAQVRVVDAARDAALAAARGETDAAAAAAAQAAAPPRAQVEIRHLAGSVVAVVRAPVVLPGTRMGGATGPLAMIPAPEVVASAVAVSEPGS